MAFPNPLRLAGALTLFGMLASAASEAQGIATGDEDARSHSSPTYLINLDRPAVPSKGKFHFNLDVRPFGSLENLTYTTFSAEYGFSDRLGFLFRGGGTDRRFTSPNGALLAQGGREYEVGLRLALKDRGGMRLALQGSALLPDARPNSRAALGGQFLLEKRVNSRLSLLLNPRAFLGKTFVATLGGGIQYQFTPSLALIGDLSGPFIGDNGVATATGSAIKKEVWGLGLRYAPPVLNGKATFDFGITNGLGRTLGLSSQDGIGGSSAVFFSLSVRP